MLPSKPGKIRYRITELQRKYWTHWPWKCRLPTSNSGLTRKAVRRADYQLPPQTFRVGNSGGVQQSHASKLSVTLTHTEVWEPLIRSTHSPDEEDTKPVTSFNSPVKLVAKVTREVPINFQNDSYIIYLNPSSPTGSSRPTRSTLQCDSPITAIVSETDRQKFLNNLHLICKERLHVTDLSTKATTQIPQAFFCLVSRVNCCWYQQWWVLSCFGCVLVRFWGRWQSFPEHMFLIVWFWFVGFSRTRKVYTKGVWRAIITKNLNQELGGQKLLREKGTSLPPPQKRKLRISTLEYIVWHFLNNRFIFSFMFHLL